MHILFQFHTGESLNRQEDFGPNHPNTKSGFIRDLLDQQNTDEELQIPLPSSITRDALVIFCNHILYHENANEAVGFGKYSERTYKYVYKTVPSYVRWMRSLDDQSQGIQHLLSWIDSTSEIQRTILTVIRRNLIMMTMKVLMPQRKTFMPMTNLTIMILMNLTIMILVNLTIMGLRVGIRDYALPKNMPDCGFKFRIIFNCLVSKMLRGILGLLSFESFLINQAMLCLN